MLCVGQETTQANGAIRFIPGSHSWDRKLAPKEEFVVYAEMEPGDAFFMLGSTFDDGSANTTTNEERLVYSCFMTKALSAPGEQKFISCIIYSIGTK